MALSPVELAGRAASGDFTPEVLEWLRDSFRAHSRAQGEVPVGMCLRLPTTARQYRLAARDAALQRVARRLPVLGRWQRARALHMACSAFRNRFLAWRQWGTAPDYASEDERDLFEAFSYAEPPVSVEGLLEVLDGD